MMGKLWSTRATAMWLLLAMALMIPTAALAGPPDESGAVEREPRLSAWLLSGDGVHVVTGPSLEEGCFGDGFQEPITTVVSPPAGLTLANVTHTDHVWVFDDEGIDDVLEWLFGRACPAVLAGEPAPVPLASGEGLVKVNSRVDDDGIEHGRVGVTATLSTAAGERVHLNAHGEIGGADFVNFGG